MGTFCLSPMEWPAARLKVGTAASLPSRSVEENYLNNTRRLRNFSLHPFAGRSLACAKLFPEYGDPRSAERGRGHFRPRQDPSD
jgi:hypothetical protein